MQAAFRPYLSAINGNMSVPMTPPAWKTPFIEPVRAVALDRVARSKYLMNDGWPVSISAPGRKTWRVVVYQVLFQ